MQNDSIHVLYRDISYTDVHSLPETMLMTMKILVATSVYSLRTLPSLDLFSNLIEANLTYPSHCCAFANFRNNRSVVLSHHQSKALLALRLSLAPKSQMVVFIHTYINVTAAYDM